MKSRRISALLHLFYSKGKLIDIEDVEDYEHRRGCQSVCVVCERAWRRGVLVNKSIFVCSGCVNQAEMLYDLESMGL